MIYPEDPLALEAETWLALTPKLKCRKCHDPIERGHRYYPGGEDERPVHYCCRAREAQIEAALGF